MPKSFLKSAMLVGMIILVGCPGPDGPIAEPGFWEEERVDSFVIRVSHQTRSHGYEPVEPGAMLDIMNGVQGGQHFGLNVEIDESAGATFTDARVGARLSTADGTVIAESFFRLGASPYTSQTVSMFAVMSPYQFADQPLTLEVRVIDAAERQATSVFDVSL